jgi:hypothetical protein
LSSSIPRFGNVEQVASERIGRETVTYVSNIYKYYVAYRLVLEKNQRRAATKQVPKAAEGKNRGPRLDTMRGLRQGGGREATVNKEKTSPWDLRGGIHPPWVS